MKIKIDFEEGYEYYVTLVLTFILGWFASFFLKSPMSVLKQIFSLFF